MTADRNPPNDPRSDPRDYLRDQHQSMRVGGSAWTPETVVYALPIKWVRLEDLQDVVVTL
jgi:hypothetical protein